jgi:hypothetical protein
MVIKGAEAQMAAEEMQETAAEDSKKLIKKGMQSYIINAFVITGP